MLPRLNSIYNISIKEGELILNQDSFLKKKRINVIKNSNILKTPKF